jgi:hypothetical protein
MTNPQRRADRSSKRLRVRLRTVEDDSHITGITRDISSVGMFVETTYLLPPGTEVKIEVGDDDDVTQLDGVVAQFSKLKPDESGVQVQGIGIKFRLTDEQAAALIHP